MSKNDWYRRRTWTKKDQEDFFARLGRARSDYNKAQYLRIQAYYLQSAATPPNYQAALDLLDYLFREVPDPNEIAAASLQRAKCLEAVGRVEEALRAYRDSIKFGLNKNNIQTTDAPFHFARFVLKNNLKGLYHEVLSGLKGSEIVSLLPDNQYLFCAIMAIVASENGLMKEAKKHAMKAIEILKNSGLQDYEQFIYQRITELAG